MIELLAVLVIFVLLIATFVPYAMSIRETSNRARCAAHLGYINRALRDYAEPNGYLYPRVRYSAALGNRWTAFTGADDANPFAADSAVSPNDVTASLWLLVREGLAQPDWFVCPSGGGTVDRMLDAGGAQTAVKKRGNFRSPDHLGYGYATPFSTMPDYRLSDTLPSRFVLLADRPPANPAAVAFDASPRRLRSVNSANHGGAGQNVLYADGTVSFEASPYSGVREARPAGDAAPAVDRLDGDNVFTALAPQPLVDTTPPHNGPGVFGQGVGPAYRYDTLLVPAQGFVESAAPATTRPTAPPASVPASLPTSVPATAPTSAPTSQP